MNFLEDKNKIQIPINILINSHDSFNSTAHSTPYISGNGTENIASMNSSMQYEDIKGYSSKNNLQTNPTISMVKKAIMNNINDSAREIGRKDEFFNADRISSGKLSLNNIAMTNQNINNPYHNNNTTQAIDFTMINNENKLMKDEVHCMMSRMDWILNLKKIFDDSNKLMKYKNININSKLFLQNIIQKSKVIEIIYIYLTNFRSYL